MPLLTTVIGSFPKPDYLKIPDWFSAPTGMSTPYYNEYLQKTAQNAELEKVANKAIKEILELETSIGIDIITDGEMLRENYVFHFCRKLNGFDFSNLATKSIRNGASNMLVPVIVDTVHCDDATFIVDEWRKAQSMTKTPVKVTIPGPMTIICSSVNRFYKEEKALNLDLALCVNTCLKALQRAGCKYIQIDEPVLVRNPDAAMDYGIDHLSRCLDGLGKEINKTVHLCCGYPEYLDQEDYLKADKSIYFQIAEKLDCAGFDQASIEDAHCHNDLSLLGKFKETNIILGVVAIAKSHVESQEEIRSRVKEALQYIEADRLMLAPDCGLGYLPYNILKQKLTNMVTVAKSMP